MGRILILYQYSRYGPAYRVYHVILLGDGNLTCGERDCNQKGTHMFNMLCGLGPILTCTIMCIDHFSKILPKFIDPFLDNFNGYVESMVNAIYPMGKKIPKDVVFRIGYRLQSYVTVKRRYTLSGKNEFPRESEKKFGAFVAFYDRTCRIAKRSIRWVWKLREQLGGGKDLIQLLSRMLWVDRGAWAERTQWIK